jgi:DNA-binding CsgD family transcriptional regulator
MQRFGRFDSEASGYLDPEVMATSEPEILFVVALAGLVRLLWPHLIRMLAHSNPGLELTRREIEILSCVATGMTNAETAQLLSIAPGTVKKHLDHIYGKLGVGTRTEAVFMAMGMRAKRAEAVRNPS